MKVTPEHLEILQTLVAVHDTPENRTAYELGNFPRSSLVKDLSTRYRWDLYWHATSLGNSLPDSTNGYNNAHIDTALKSIIPAVERKY